MLRSLATQLCQRSVRSEAQLHNLFQSCQVGQKQPPTGALLDTLREMLLHHQSVYVVLDALDESTTKKTKLLDCLKAITCIPELAHVKLLCTGRPERDLLDVMPLLIGEENYVKLNRDAIDADIGAYVKKRLDSSPGFTKWKGKPKVLEKIRATIRSKAHGMQVTYTLAPWIIMLTASIGSGGQHASWIASRCAATAKRSRKLLFPCRRTSMRHTLGCCV